MAIANSWGLSDGEGVVVKQRGPMGETAWSNWLIFFYTCFQGDQFWGRYIHNQLFKTNRVRSACDLLRVRESRWCLPPIMSFLVRSRKTGIGDIHVKVFLKKLRLRWFYVKRYGEKECKVAGSTPQ